ncbi:13229_t:CDS:2 [Acaulospora morrowiae]|uniref:13229_t:CDS:1 n=1 Tax=Acaulospora morrowiae TaxID=94023 RepID=A0A9N9G8E4_9GLOM|nr:13229_t:CDS:2 [Acaulospora morrowiae]
MTINSQGGRWKMTKYFTTATWAARFWEVNFAQAGSHCHLGGPRTFFLNKPPKIGFFDSLSNYNKYFRAGDHYFDALIVDSPTKCIQPLDLHDLC